MHVIKVHMIMCWAYLEEEAVGKSDDDEAGVGVGEGEHDAGADGGEERAEEHRSTAIRLRQRAERKAANHHAEEVDGRCQIVEVIPVAHQVELRRKRTQE